MNKNELYAYTAGLIDGEGYISLLKAYNTDHQYTPVVKVSSTDPYMTVFLHANFGGHLDKIRTHRPPQKPSRMWTLRNGRNVSKFLEKIYPYLLVKKAQAGLVMEYSSKYSQNSLRNPEIWAEKDEYYRQVRLLTRRGIAPAETK